MKAIKVCPNKKLNLMQRKEQLGWPIYDIIRDLMNDTNMIYTI